jgi:N-acetyl-alpha-D-muramate 1-phosphate uridylyltransferase
VIHAGPMTSAPLDQRPVGVVLAAGVGTRLRPLTELRPKALCPVANRPLVDWALDRVAPHVGRTAVNVHHHLEQMLAHLSGRGVHVSVEEPVALGTAGALGRLRDWVAGAAVLLTNADSWSPAEPDPLARLLDGWDGERPRLLCRLDPARGDFGDLRYVGSALLPWWSVRDLPPTPAGLYEASWQALTEEGRVDLVVDDRVHIDCGAPADYLRANLAASGGGSVIGEGAVVEGAVIRSVVWPGARVLPDERLVDSIRADGLTVRPGRG